MDKTIFKYVRNKRREKVGVVVAGRLVGNVIGVGWSKVNTSAGDDFDPERGMQIALDRLEKGWGPSVKMPTIVADDYLYMIERAKKYFKGCKLVEY